MTNPELPNKPLVEVILEIRWKPRDSNENSDSPLDEDYKFALGKFRDLIEHKFPKHEPLPASTIPEELVFNTVHHRFRVAEDEWPLVQIGPGVLSLNYTQTYKWENFLPECLETVSSLYRTYPASRPLVPSTFMIRYIDAFRIMDSDPNNALEFLRDMLGTTIQLPILKNSPQGNDTPLSISLAVELPTSAPVGIFALKISSGTLRGDAAIILDTSLTSKGNDVLSNSDAASTELERWLVSSHVLLYDAFKSLTKGKLLERFENV